MYQRMYSPGIVGSPQKKNTGEVPQYYIEQHHTAIIEADVWGLVQEKLEERRWKRAPRNTSQDRVGQELFYRRFYCSKCQGVISRYGDQRKQNSSAGSL